MAHGIEHRQVVRAELQRPVDLAVRVERGIPAVGRDLIVQIRLWVRPVPLGDHDIALQALRPRRRRRDGARGDPIGPVGEHRERALPAELTHDAEHLATRLSRLQAPLPGSR